jgi:putative peptide zinc metalloprotease protein
MQTLLSEHWHAVRSLRPRLRDGVQPLHRRLRGKPWVLLHDPLTQRFHRITPQVWRVLQLLDGQRTLDEVWNAACEQIDPDATGSEGTAISQHELVQLMSALHGSDLLQTQVSPDAGEVFERYRKQQRAKWKQSFLNPASLKLPLLYPDAWFDKQAGLARAMFSWGALALWLALVAPAAALAWQHWSALTENLSDRVLSGSNVVLLWFTYPIVKAVHEWAHGMAVKAFGGNVREMGLMFVVLTPVPYVDATSSYRFPSKWARATVAAAGILAELAMGAVAVYVWLLAESGLVTAIAFNVLLISGVSTVVVNGNPLMRYDGYFIMCDLLEVPNLQQRATQYWAYLFDRFAYGARDATPPAGAQDERWLLMSYGAVAPFYRLAVSVGLIWFVVGEYLLLGVVMAVTSAWSSLVMPLWKGWKHLHEAGALARRRDQAKRRTAVVIALAALVLCAVPLPFNSVQQAVVWLPDEAIVRSQVSAHVAAASVASGQSVTLGAPVLALDSPALDAELASAQGALAQVQAQLRKAEIDDRVRAEPLRSEERSRAARLADVQRRHDALELHAKAQGRWVPAASGELVGRYVKRGEVVGYVVTGPSNVVRTAVTQEDMDLIQSRVRGVQVRLANRVRDPIDARISRRVPGGEFDLVSAALGTNGGGDIAVDPSHQEGTRSLKRVFDVEVALERSTAATVFGDRAYVRFDLGNAPLAWQWFLRVRQLFLARLNV